MHSTQMRSYAMATERWRAKVMILLNAGLASQSFIVDGASSLRQDFIVLQARSNYADTYTKGNHRSGSFGAAFSIQWQMEGPEARAASQASADHSSGDALRFQHGQAPGQAQAVGKHYAEFYICCEGTSLHPARTGRPCRSRHSFWMRHVSMSDPQSRQAPEPSQVLAPVSTHPGH